MREIKGNIKGIRDSVIAELQKLYDMQSPQLVSQELAVKLADITEYINREISVYITRSGQIIEIAVGDNATVELPSFSGAEPDALAVYAAYIRIRAATRI